MKTRTTTPSATTGLLAVLMLAAGCQGDPETASDWPEDAGRPVLYDMRWIESSPSNWPVRSEWTGSDPRNRTLVWYAAGSREVARLEVRDGKPYEGVVYENRGPNMRAVQVYHLGEAVGGGVFRREGEKGWQLVGARWAYEGRR